MQNMQCGMRHAALATTNMQVTYIAGLNGKG
jgi:hypothetical protein